MRRLIAFNNVTLDGYFSGPNGDFSWAHQAAPDQEWNDFVAGNAGAGGTLVLGRITYEIMASYWPTPLAAQHDPVVAKHMNELSKIVFSHTLTDPVWSNTRVLAGAVVAEMRRLKSEPGPGMALLGSGSLVAPLAAARLIDELQVVVHPIVLGSGRTMFAGVPGPLPLKLKQTRAFRNGNVLLSYEPSA